MEAKLTASDAIDDGYFGYSVSLSGNRALIGSYQDNESGIDSGSAYIFELIGGTWVQTAKLTASDATDFTTFGYSVSLSGNRALVGAIEDIELGKSIADGEKSADRGGYVFGSGSAYIFDLVGGNWQETTKLVTNTGVDGDHFGFSVSLLGDRALIGAYLSDDNGTSSGSAYIFDLTGGNWTETAQLNANDADTGDYFGIAVSLAEDRALIGAAFDENNGPPLSGSAYIFDLTGGTWSETTKLIASDAVAGDNFGVSVSLLEDRILIGAMLDDDNGVNSGSAYLFDLTGGVWSETKKLTANGAVGFELFGYSVHLSGDRALIGAYLDDENGNSFGAAYVFGITPTGTVEPSIVPSLNFTGILLLSLLILVFMRFNSSKNIIQRLYKQTNSSKG